MIERAYPPSPPPCAMSVPKMQHDGNTHDMTSAPLLAYIPLYDYELVTVWRWTHSQQQRRRVMRVRSMAMTHSPSVEIGKPTFIFGRVGVGIGGL